MPEISRRASSLGTENAFVVLAEVNALLEGLEDTVRWYVDNRDWVEGIRQRGFQSERLGLVKA